MMRGLLRFTTAAALVIVANASSNAAIKEINYPAVNVETAKLFVANQNFERMRTALADAIAKKDAPSLFALVGPTFVWLTNGGLSGDFDLGRDALHNFKVAMGFREPGKNEDLATVADAVWENLADFNKEKTYFAGGDNLACGPMSASVKDQAGFDRAAQRIAADDSTVWFFVLTDTPATPTPGGTGTPVGRIGGKTAVPVLKTHPPAAAGQPEPLATHLQVLLPSGKPGWIPITLGRPLVSDRLCYSETESGDWKITTYEGVD